MTYAIGGLLVGIGIVLFRKTGMVSRIFGCAIVLLGVAMIGLAFMVDAKRQGAI